MTDAPAKKKRVYAKRLTAQDKAEIASAFETSHGIIPIEIRPGHYVRIHGIPHDLKRTEAEKVAGVVYALGGNYG